MEGRKLLLQVNLSLISLVKSFNSVKVSGTVHNEHHCKYCMLESIKRLVFVCSPLARCDVGNLKINKPV